MSKINIKLDEQHIELIKHFKFEKINDYKLCVDMWNPYGGNYLMEDLAMIFGIWDKFTPGSELHYDGKKYGYDEEKKMLEYHTYLMDNIDYVLDIIFKFISDGVKIGTYSCIDYELKWSYKKN